MKITANSSQLKYLTLGAGGLGLALRFALYATGMDGRNLLITGHWANTAVWMITAVTLAGLILLCRTLAGPETYSDCHPVSAPAALGAALGGCAILVTAIGEFSYFTRLDLIVTALGIAAGISLLVLAACRLTGRKATPLLHALVSLFFAIRMIRQYQLWSSDPQVQNYCFYLCAYVALMLSAYHHAEFEADMGNHKRLWMYSLAAVYFCALSLKGTVDTCLLLGCGVWAFTNLTNLTGPVITQNQS